MSSLVPYTKSAELAAAFPEFASLTVYGSFEDPLFLSSQVKELLGLSKIHTEDLDLNDEYIKVKVHSGGQLREQNLLTEQGLYTIISRSRTDLGRKFRRFIKVVFKELRTKGQVTLDDALVKLQQELTASKQYVIVLDEECERMREKELLIEQHNEELKTQLAQAQTKSSHLRAACRHLLDEDVAEDRSKASTEQLLWDQTKNENILQQFHFTRVDEDDLEPAEDEDVIWKFSKQSTTGTSFPVYVWPRITLKEVADTLIAAEHGVRVRNNWSRTTFQGSQNEIQAAVNQLLLKK